MTTPDRLARRWLINRLATDTDLSAAAVGGVHYGLAPAGLAKPTVIVTGTDPDDVRVTDRRRVLVNGSWRVLVWFDEDTDRTAVATAVDRIDELLERANDTTAELTISTERLRSHSQTASSDGDLIFAEGGWFRYSAH